MPQQECRCPPHLIRITRRRMIYRLVKAFLSQSDAGHAAPLYVMFILEAPDLPLAAVHFDEVLT